MGFGENVVQIVINARDQFSATFQKAKIGLKNCRASMIAAGVGGALLAAGMFKAVKSANEVETGFAKVNTLLDKGQDSQKIFGDYVKKSNITLGNQGDQLDVLNGLYQTISAGITDVTDAQKVMDAAIKSTVGGSAEQGDVINALTKTMAAYGMGAEDAARITDIFAGTVKAGQTTMGELASAFPNIAGLAGEAGISLEETAGTLAGLTKFLGSTDEASTALGQTIISFLKPQTEMEEAMKSLGYESGAAMLKELGLNEAVKKLVGTTDGSADSIAELFKNKSALIGVLPMVGKGMDDISSSIDIVTNSTGLADKQFEDLTNTTQYKWGQAVSDIQNLQTDFGNSLKETLLPIIEKLIELIKKVADWWNNLSPAMKQAITIMAVVTTALLLLAGAVVIFQLAASPILLIILAVALVITGIILLIMHWKEVMQWIGDIFVWLWKKVLQPIWNFLKKIFAPQIAIITTIFELLKIAIGKLGDAFTWLWEKVLKPVWDFFKKIYDWLKEKFLDVIGSVVDKLKSVIKLAKKARGKIASAAGSVLGSKKDGGYIPETGPYLLHQGEYVVPKVNDFIINPNGKMFETNPNDTIIGTKNPGSLGGNGTVENIYNINIENLNATDADSVADLLQDALSNQINT